MNAKSRIFLVTIASAFALVALTPALASATSILGTVSAEGGGPLQSVEVCPTPQPYTFEVDCAETDASGNYLLPGLPSGDYQVYFSAWPHNLPYVSEFYDNAHYSWEADLFHFDASQNAVLDVALAPGGSIAGTVSDENTHAPIAGIWACAIDQQGIPPRCALSDADGDYQLNGLPSGTYSVEYEGGNRVNYLREFYEDAQTWAAATDVNIIAPGLTPGIDAELAPGAEILGHVSDPGTGAPSRGVFVCANEQDPGEYQGCDSTDAAGDYAIRSLPAGTYLVAFELEYLPTGLFAKQWWDGVATMAEADPIEIAPPESRTGIDGQATSPFWPQETGGEEHAVLSPPPFVSPPPVLKKPWPKCKKGFHRRWAKGKRKCVRKHRPRHGRH
jgi:hypothetical protein